MLDCKIIFVSLFVDRNNSTGTFVPLRGLFDSMFFSLSLPRSLIRLLHHHLHLTGVDWTCTIICLHVLRVTGCTNSFSQIVCYFRLFIYLQSSLTIRHTTRYEIRDFRNNRTPGGEIWINYFRFTRVRGENNINNNNNKTQTPRLKPTTVRLISLCACCLHSPVRMYSIENKSIN